MSIKSFFNIRSCSVGVLLLGLLGVPVVLLAAYYLTGFLLARQVENNFAAHDCGYVLDNSPSLGKYYPEQIAPFTKQLPALEKECQAYYVNAKKLQDVEFWDAAYKGYLAYMHQYPDGEFVQDAQQAAGETLYSWALQNEAANAFEDAEEHLLTLIDEQADSAAAQQATAYLPNIYLHWGQYLDEKKEFFKAEEKLLHLTNKYPDSEASSMADTSLAGLYLHWAQDWHTKKNYRLAESMYQKAEKIDPDPDAVHSPTADAEIGLNQVYREWGEQLIGAKEFDQALAKFQTLQQRLASNERDEVKTWISDAYMRWAEALQDEDDFTQALEKIDSAKTYATNDSQKAGVEKLNSTVTSNYAHSNGKQAREVMGSAASYVCKNSAPFSSSLIAFDNQDNKVFFSVSYITGSLYSLPKTLTATTPASMHYVACVTRTKALLQTCPYRTASAKIYYVQRYRVSWDVILRDAKTGEKLGQQLFNGTTPKACPYRETFSLSSTTKTYIGDNPVAAVETWIKKLMP